MSLVNCGRCEQPFLSSTNISICASCLSRETHLFESYYYRVEKLIREKGLDSYLSAFPRDKERFKNAAHLRIGTGLVLKLDSWRRGTCYVCSGAQSHRESKEPICSECFEIFFKTLSVDPKGLSLLVKKGDAAPPMAKAVKDSALTDALLPAELNELKKLQEELARYRNYYGELRPTGCRVVQEEPVRAKVSLPPEMIQLITEQVLEILSMSDEEISLDHIDWKRLGLSGAGIQDLETIRLTGFKRLPTVF